MSPGKQYDQYSPRPRDQEAFNMDEPASLFQDPESLIVAMERVTVLFDRYTQSLNVTYFILYSLYFLYPHSTGRHLRYAHGDHGVSLKLFQIAAESHTIWGLHASSTLPLRFYNASVTLLPRCSRFGCVVIAFLLRSRYDNEDPVSLSLR